MNRLSGILGAALFLTAAGWFTTNNAKQRRIGALGVANHQLDSLRTDAIDKGWSLAATATATLGRVDSLERILVAVRTQAAVAAQQARELALEWTTVRDAYLTRNPADTSTVNVGAIVASADAAVRSCSDALTSCEHRATLEKRQADSLRVVAAERLTAMGAFARADTLSQRKAHNLEGMIPSTVGNVARAGVTAGVSVIVTYFACHFTRKC